jgi:hypothetical protein
MHGVNDNGRGNINVNENSYFHFKLFPLLHVYKPTKSEENTELTSIM